MKKKILIFTSLFTFILTIGLFGTKASANEELPSTDSEEFTQRMNADFEKFYLNKPIYNQYNKDGSRDGVIVDGGLTIETCGDTITINGTVTAKYGYSLYIVKDYVTSSDYDPSSFIYYSNVNLRDYGSNVQLNIGYYENGSSKSISTNASSAGHTIDYKNIRSLYFNFSNGYTFDNVIIKIIELNYYYLGTYYINKFTTDTMLNIDTYYGMEYQTYDNLYYLYTSFYKKAFSNITLNACLNYYASSIGKVSPFSNYYSYIQYEFNDVFEFAYNDSQKYYKSFAGGTSDSFTQEDLDNAYNNGYDEGYNNGFVDGEYEHVNDYQNGYDNGFVDGEYEHVNDYQDGYNKGYADSTSDNTLKRVLGPLHNGCYFGYVDGDMSSSSTISLFNDEYVDLIKNNSIDLNSIVQTISADLSVGNRYDIYFDLNEYELLKNANISLSGINEISFYCDDNKVYSQTITNYRDLTNLTDININSNYNLIILTILDYDTFLKCDGKFMFNNIDESYYTGYNDGYSNGLINGSNSIDTDIYYDKGYQDGSKDGFEFGEREGYTSGYNDGIIENIEENVNLDDYYKNYFDKGYQDGYDKGYSEGEKLGLQVKNLFWDIAALPFESFKSVWNFELLGFNIAKFFTGFLMVFIVLYIIKKIFL